MIQTIHPSIFLSFPFPIPSNSGSGSGVVAATYLSAFEINRRYIAKHGLGLCLFGFFLLKRKRGQNIMA
jgi:hypothetical protein